MHFDYAIREAVDWDTPAIEAENSLHQAVSRMIASGVSALVVKMNGIVAGIISDHDMAMAFSRNADFHATRVADIMTACAMVTAKGAADPCIQLDEGETIGNALKVLAASGTHHLLVGGADDRSAGVVSIHRLFQAALGSLGNR